MNSCYGCKFASKLREHHRKGDQVKCAKATKLFGGEHWVNVLRSEAGELLPSKCGQFESVIEPAPEKAKEVMPQEVTYQIDYLIDWSEESEEEGCTACSFCGGTGDIVISIIKGAPVWGTCTYCEGSGIIFDEEEN